METTELQEEPNHIFRVQKIDVFPSISGAINIGLTLDADERFEAVNVGDRVYKIL